MKERTRILFTILLAGSMGTLLASCTPYGGVTIGVPFGGHPAQGQPYISPTVGVGYPGR